MDSISPAIRFSDVDLAFGERVRVFESLDLTVERGRHVALIGRSGAGKTSLLAMAAGLLKPVRGVVSTLGCDLNGMDEDALAGMRQRNVGIVFQHFHLMPTMNAVENVALPLELAGRAEATTTAERMLRAVGMDSRLRHFPSQLSGGEQQRVAIARAFVSTPPLLLADEPTGNLDDETSVRILDTLFDLGRETTILFITHNHAILDRFDEVLEIQGRRVVTAS